MENLLLSHSVEERPLVKLEFSEGRRGEFDCFSISLEYFSLSNTRWKLLLTGGGGGGCRLIGAGEGGVSNLKIFIVN